MSAEKTAENRPILPPEIDHLLRQIEAQTAIKPPVLPTIAPQDDAAVRRILLDAAAFNAGDCE